MLLVLHPQLKLRYFQQQGWEKGWVETAEEIIRDEFSKYDNLEADNASQAPAVSDAVTDDEAVDFYDIPMDGIAEPHELDDYLSQPIEKVRNPITWWWDHRHIFPKLSKMAFDYLSIPGMCFICVATCFQVVDI